MLIDEPPIATACSGCAKPLVWLYSARTSKWVAVIPDPTDARTMRVHECRDGVPQRTWRDAHTAAGDAARGRALVDAALRGEDL